MIENYLSTYGLEIRATQHCNLRCRGCSQNSPLMPKYVADISSIERSLSLLERVLRADRATVVGGEPLMHPQIDDLLSVVRKSGIFRLIFLTTNGVYLHQMSQKFWSLVDVVEVSVYPDTEELVKRNINKCIHAAMCGGAQINLLPCGRFRDILTSTPVEPEKLADRVFRECKLKQFCHTLFEGRFYRCAPSVNIEFGLSGDCSRNAEDDSLEICEDGDMKRRLKNYLDSEAPLSACRYCLGSSGREFKHEQIGCSDYLIPEFSPNLLTSTT